MGAVADHVEVLDAEECLALMSTRLIGRVGAMIDSLPVVLPVCFDLHDDVVVIRLGRDSDLAAAVHHDIVAFEVDDFDPTTGEGWSVLVRGIAREIGEPSGQFGRTPCRAGWLDPVLSRYVGISTDVVSGRRVRGVLGPSIVERTEVSG